eukprot:TRINITY_DN2286_c0_g1_i1.p1 TRINITY_DN2286_c0_g1~~TRINITY_DN2286_c0_g1_i1.p1  ORF type:complete len:353 (-),score=37.26 TRINITY_DN2286_c0_g1_i1:242-1300(-)
MSKLSVLLLFLIALVQCDYLQTALSAIDVLVKNHYSNVEGTFNGELLWQSGNTIETISNAMILSNSTTWALILSNTYQKTPVVVDTCFDDHQWWLLGWIKAYQATKNQLYLQRAASAFDFVANNGWTPLCGGGVLWCPSPATPYKNAITNELFITSAMSLHQYSSLLGRPTNYYLNWAIKGWNWFQSSGMLNGVSLINDGLDGVCKNNQGVTWTYNQGVLLTGLGMLAKAKNDKSYILTAENIINAVLNHLTLPSGILHEPCDQCSGDSYIFKGIFLRHLGYFVSIVTKKDLMSFNNVKDFVTQNVASIQKSDVCTEGYGLNWEGPPILCVPSCTSSAIDALLTADVLSTIQ